MSDDDALLSGSWQLLPETREALRLSRVRQLIARKEWGEAIIEAEELLDASPEHVEAQTALADALLQAGDVLSARELLEHLAEGPTPPRSIWVAVAQARFECCDFPAALEAAREAVRRNPELAEAHYQLGLVLERSGRSSEASKAFVTAVTLDPDEFRLPLSLDEAAAAEIYEQALESLPRVLQRFWEDVPVEYDPYPDPAVLLESTEPISPRVVALFDGEPPEDGDPWQERPDALRVYIGNLALSDSEDAAATLLAMTLEHEAEDWLAVDDEPNDDEDEA